MILTPTYHVMNMYKVHQDALLLPTKVENNPDYNGLLALSVSASKTDDGKTNISLVNIDISETIEVEIDADKISNVSAQILTSKKVQDHNTFDNPDKVKPTQFKDFKVKNGKILVKIPPISVLVFEGQ